MLLKIYCFYHNVFINNNQMCFIVIINLKMYRIEHLNGLLLKKILRKKLIDWINIFLKKK